MRPALLLVRGGIQFPMMVVLMTVLGSVDATVLGMKIMVTVRTLIRHLTRVSAQQLLPMKWVNGRFAITHTKVFTDGLGALDDSWSTKRRSKCVPAAAPVSSYNGP